MRHGKKGDILDKNIIKLIRPYILGIAFIVYHKYHAATTIAIRFIIRTHTSATLQPSTWKFRFFLYR